ncbi:hypothetical protein Goari_022783 [Gossypium aridum]|uniref:DUF4283 domain-containing protein n=1 Tax=Gossypium aridum TaxID=34290 RepID=A0A7J8YR93_GOSAI|nr:hypothetical protein [Gossypium aridum]
MDFNPVQPYSSVFKAWIRILGLSRFLYKRRMLEEIERLIRKVSKLDFNIDSRMRGKFTRMVVYVNLDKPLTYQVLVNNTLQRVEFESLSVMCFGRGRYDHLKEAYPKDAGLGTVGTRFDALIPGDKSTTSLGSLGQVNKLNHGMGFGAAERKVSAEASLGLSQIEQRAVALGKQPSSLIELNVEGSMVG